MKTEIRINQIIIDNPDLIKQELQNGKNWQVTVFDGTDNDKAVGVFLEKTEKDKECTIMFDLTEKEALFLGKSLISMAESI
tara:strand:- start:266 stop:508 length:243 start_codon:yes stop_codon:yes gene_type:complete